MLRGLTYLLRAFLYRVRGECTTEKLLSMGMRIGKNFNRQYGVILDPSHCWLISIGDNVTIAPRVHILAHDASTYLYLGYTKIGRVNIGNNVFIGAESVVLPNVTIGDNVVIGANSTVTKDIPPNTVYAGNPAQYVSSIEEFINKNKELKKYRPYYGEEYTVRKKVTGQRKQKMVDELAEGPGYVV
ncbi:MAG: acyltransferase [Veillonellales bacterium]